MKSVALHVLSLLLLAAACAMAAGAQAVVVNPAYRTWVSGTGDDAAACTRVAPCKTFAAAIAQTIAGGEIAVIDAGGFGAVTITKSITISARGAFAGVLSNGVNTITVNAGPTDVIYLRGIDLNGAGDGTGTSGISFVAGGALHVEDSNIYGFSGQGIDFAPSGKGELYVSNSSMRNNVGGGIYVHPAPGGSARGTIANVTLSGNGRGVRVEDGSVILVKNSLAAGGDMAGFNVVSTTFPAMLTIESSTSTNNQSGVRASGANAFLRLNNTTVIGNTGVGLSVAGGGSIISFGNNRVSGNGGGNGAPTSSEPSM